MVNDTSRTDKFLVTTCSYLAASLSLATIPLSPGLPSIHGQTSKHQGRLQILGSLTDYYNEIGNNLDVCQQLEQTFVEINHIYIFFIVIQNGFYVNKKDLFYFNIVVIVIIRFCVFLSILATLLLCLPCTSANLVLVSFLQEQ